MARLCFFSYRVLSSPLYKTQKVYFDGFWNSHYDSAQLFLVDFLPPKNPYFCAYLFADDVLTCWKGEGHQVSEEIAGEVTLALVKGGCYLSTDLLR